MDRVKPLDEPVVTVNIIFCVARNYLPFLLSLSPPPVGMDILRLTLKYSIVGLASTVYAAGWLFLSVLSAVGHVSRIAHSPLPPSSPRPEARHTREPHKQEHILTGSQEPKTPPPPQHPPKNPQPSPEASTSSLTPSSSASEASLTKTASPSAHVRFTHLKHSLPRSASSESVVYAATPGLAGDSICGRLRQHGMFRSCSSTAESDDSATGHEFAKSSGLAEKCKRRSLPLGLAGLSAGAAPHSQRSRRAGGSSAPIASAISTEFDHGTYDASEGSAGSRDNQRVVHQDKRRRSRKMKSYPPIVARTDPYQAPYFFPAPGSPEAHDYVRRVRSDRSLPRTVVLRESITEPPPVPKVLLPNGVLTDSPRPSRRSSYDPHTLKIRSASPERPSRSQARRRTLSADVQVSVPASHADLPVSEDGQLLLPRSDSSLSSSKGKRSWRSRLSSFGPRHRGYL